MLLSTLVQVILPDIMQISHSDSGTQLCIIMKEEAVIDPCQSNKGLVRLVALYLATGNPGAI